MKISNESMQWDGDIGLRQSEVAQIIGVSLSTLEAWRREGRGPEYIKAGPAGGRGRVIYLKSTVAKWLANTIKTA